MWHIVACDKLPHVRQELNYCLICLPWHGEGEGGIRYAHIYTHDVAVAPNKTMVHWCGNCHIPDLLP